jgi:putative transport protein
MAMRDFLTRYPELTLFLVIALGYFIGSFQIHRFSLGPVTGSLFAGIAVGQFARVADSPMTKSFLFLMFLFGIGYSVGPQFLQALRRDGLKPVILAVFVCVVGLASAIAVSSLLSLDVGFSAGLLSGALTESPAMGTATEAINALPLPPAERARLVGHIAVADAVCYVFGAFGVIVFCSVVAPALLGIDLEAEARRLEQTLGIVGSQDWRQSAWREFETRAYPVAGSSRLAGITVAQAEALVPEHRVFIQRIRRQGALVAPEPAFTLREGDILALSGPREVIVEFIGRRGEEIEDRSLLDIPVTLADIALQRRELSGTSPDRLLAKPWMRGVYLKAIRRGGLDIPIAPGITLERGDLVRIVGPEDRVAAAARTMGVAIDAHAKADFVVLGLAIFLGGLVGVLVGVPVAGVRIALSTSVGALLAGLVVGHFKTRFPLFGRIPDDAVAFMTALGLAAFVGMTGLHAGPIFFSALADVGLSLFLGGIVVTSLPMVLGLLFGHFVLRLNPILTLGALAGAQTMTAAMAAVQDRSKSTVAVLGFTPAVPIGHVLLTSWGAVIVIVMAR